MNALTRSDMIEISYTPIGGDRTRLRFEPSDETTRQPETHPTTEEWIAHTVCVSLAWSALDAAVREEMGQ